MTQSQGGTEARRHGVTEQSAVSAVNAGPPSTVTDRQRTITRALGSITNRIFLACTLLATVSIGAGVFFVSNLLRAEAEAELERDLNEAGNLLEQQRASLLEGFMLTAQLIADLPTLKAAVGTRDAPTVRPIADEYRRQAGSDFFVVTDRSGVVLAAFGGDEALDEEMREATSVRKALHGELALAHWAHPGGVMQVVSVPVAVGQELLGSLTVGYLLDNTRAAQFKELTGADIAFAVDGKIRASTLGTEFHEALVPLLEEERIPRVQIADVEYTALVKRLPLPTSVAVETASGSSIPKALVLRSRTERIRTLSAIQRGLAVVALLTVLLAVAVSYGVARTITRPLATITNHMREVANTGDLTRKIPLTRTRGWQDEDARLLATTFNTLTDSVSRFQREAAQRERLSSLGRMSTIIAHEVRNPLMIIKGALRQITHAGATSDDIRESASDINGEIERLNRVVNEVLDFARPIRFDLSPADVNALCRSAAAAVEAAHRDPPIVVTLAPHLPLLQSDGERLRVVLVNLLTNARQAVASDEPVRLVTSRVGDRRVAISIEDRGAGIAADDLPHIFDPYFTTRRAGTGLGLPIAKNIIDGLGGTITVESAHGQGTTIRIELGDAPPGRR
jgi:signal transduction histidine kinase